MPINNKEYCGTIVFEVDSKEYEIMSVDVTQRTGRKLVKTMNSKKRALGSSCGSMEYSLKVEAGIPLDGSEPNWAAMQNGTITIYPACGSSSKREIFTGCFVEEVGSKYNDGSEAKRSLSIGALDKIDG